MEKAEENKLDDISGELELKKRQCRQLIIHIVLVVLLQTLVWLVVFVSKGSVLGRWEGLLFFVVVILSWMLAYLMHKVKGR